MKSSNLKDLGAQTPDDLNSNPPVWLVSVVATMQAQQDRVYHSGVEIYTGAVHDWITSNLGNRMIGKQITPFTTPPPVRVIVYPTDRNTPGQFNAPVDSSLPQAVLPAEVPMTTQPSTPFVAGGSDPLLIASYELLQKIAATMGIK